MWINYYNISFIVNFRNYFMLIFFTRFKFTRFKSVKYSCTKSTNSF